MSGVNHDGGIFTHRPVPICELSLLAEVQFLTEGTNDAFKRRLPLRPKLKEGLVIHLDKQPLTVVQ